VSPAGALWAHGQTGLLLLALACLLPAPLRRLTWIVPSALALAWLPVAHLDLAAFVYAYSGALSVPTLVLLGGWVGRRTLGGRGLPGPERRALLLGGALAALLLYPMSLGLGGLDPYGLGYSGVTPALLLAAVTLLAWWSGLRIAPLAGLAALWAWLLGLGESANLWDYLVDGWLALGALGWTLVRAARLFSQFLNRRLAMYQNRPPGKRL
jgi:hypothetical protein